ncbi:MAG: aspartyl-phosphate phosphatase Spo0E family protein [Clostridia bacterium]|nr:aspartyl-phosphate phosphatase Spo0E family protein [Clostridia bacterium]
MAVDQKEDILRELEELRKKLYVSADSHLLTSQEIYQASTNLDKVIVKYLKGKYNDKHA